MQKINQEITDQNVIEEILKGANICRIAIHDVNEPYLLPFNYGYSNGCLFIHSGPKGKKLDLLTSHPNVSFEVEDKVQIIKDYSPCNWSTFYRSVIGKGTVEVITDYHQKKHGLEIIMAHHGASEKPVFDKKQVNGTVILKLNITHVSGKKSGNWDSYVHSLKHELETERLFLSEISWDDVDDIHRLHSYPEVDEFNTLGIPKNLEESRKYVRDIIDAQMKIPRKTYIWKIKLKKNSKFIGITGTILSNDIFRLAELFYKFEPVYWGHGYATEVTKRLIRFGFDHLRLHKIEAGVATENIRSVRVLEKAGMTREGLRRKMLPIRGEWKDNYHYAILESDPKGY